MKSKLAKAIISGIIISLISIFFSSLIMTISGADRIDDTTVIWITFAVLYIFFAIVVYKYYNIKINKLVDGMFRKVK